MRKRWHCPKVEISAGACLWGAVLLLAVPLPWVAAAVMAAAFHELFHCLMIWLLGGTVWEIRMGSGGTAINMVGLSNGAELLAAAAGPAGSFSLLLLAERLPPLALCGFVQGMFNLLPVYPMDGGRILFCILSLVMPMEKAEIICTWVEKGILILLLTGGVVLSLFYKLGPMPLLLVLGMTIKAKRRKNPCKEWD